MRTRSGEMRPTIGRHGCMGAVDYWQRFGIKLKCCPFCGTADVGLFPGPLPHITCFQCGADGPLQKAKRGELTLAQHDAGVEWNERAPCD